MSDTAPRAKPKSYGVWWDTNRHDESWYREIHDSRKVFHAAFQSWVRAKRDAGERIESVLEVGCGRAVEYAEFFKDVRYTGFDISQKEIDWCRANHTAPGHSFHCGDFIAEGIAETFDLVISHAVVDHVYDVNAFMTGLVKASHRWTYISAYRGWFPGLEHHSYRWDEQDTCNYNDVSTRETRRVLGALGLSELSVFPVPTFDPQIPYETAIVARKAEAAS